MRERSGRSGTREGLQERHRILVGEIREAVEAVGAEEVAWEVVEDVVVAVIEAALECVVLQNVGGCVRDLIALDGRLARREAVAPEEQNANATRKHRGLRIATV